MIFFPYLSTDTRGSCLQTKWIYQPVAPVGHGSAALLSRLWLALGVANFIPQEISGLLPAAYPFRNLLQLRFGTTT